MQNSTPDAPTWNIRTIGEVVAIYLGIVVALAYPVGFATLVLQMMSNYGFDLSTAVYATYLVPIPQVIGKVLIVMRFSIFPIMATMLWVVVLRSPLVSIVPRAARIFVRFMLVVAVLIYTPYSYAFTLTSATFVPYGGLIFLTYVLIGGAVMYFGIESLSVQIEALSTASGLESLRTWRITIALIVTGALVAAVFLAGVMNPSLPTVELSQGEQTNRATLLSHSGGYWHLIDKDQNLLSLPEDQAGEVRIVKDQSGTLEQPEG